MMRDDTTRPLIGRVRLAVALAALAATAGCTASRTTIHAHDAPMPDARTDIVVFVGSDVTGDQAAVDAARRVAADFEPKIVAELRRRGMTARSGAANAGGRALELRVRVQEVRAGNWFRRTAVGFGSGKPSLTIMAELVAPERPAIPLRRLSVETRIRARPGLLVSAGIATATGVLAPLAVVTTASVAGDHGGTSTRLEKAAARELVRRLAL